MVTRIPQGKLFWIVGPNYDLARPEFTYVLEMLDRLGAIPSKKDVSIPKMGRALLQTRTGQIIETRTADDVKKLAARAPDGILMTEAAQHPMDSYLKCLGRVAEKRGWLLMSGTFEGSEGWYPDLFYEWAVPENMDGGVSFSMPSWSNSHIYPGGRYDPEMVRLEKSYSRVPGLFDERCGAIPVPPSGLVFREFSKAKHVSSEPLYDPKLPVFLAVDPSGGANPYAVVACQFVPCKCKSQHPDDNIDICHVIDEIYVVGKNGEEVIDIAMSKPWWRKVKGGAIDVEAPDEQRRWLSLGRVYLHAEKIPQLHGIRREKSFLHYSDTMPTHLRIYQRCEGLIYEYGKYKRKDPADSDLDPKEVPPDNQPNHSIKALWYLLVRRYGFVKGRKLPRVAYSWLGPRMRQHENANS